MADIDTFRIALTPEEQRVDAWLRALRDDFLQSYHGQYNLLTDKEIWQSGLYRFCHSLPKGADLHIHGLACLPVREMTDWLMSQGDMYIHTGEMPQRGSIRVMDPSAGIPEPYKRFADAMMDGDITPEELERIWSVLGAGPDQTIWEWFETIFDRHMFASTPEIVSRYYEAVFRYYVRLNIQMVEIRILPFGTPEEAAAMATAIRDAYYRVMDTEPGFCVRLLGCGLKYAWIDLGVTAAMMENAAYIHENVKDTRRGEDFLTALDLVNEEDRSHEISFYAPLLTRLVQEHSGLKLMLHCGETLRPDSRSVEEALALHPVRIGHGFNLYDHPELQKTLLREGICMEVCPVSNLTLGYLSDPVRHPARGYYAAGIPVVLASDDPAFQEHNNLVDDFFVAAAAWDMGLADLKQLAFNSIRYCSAGPATRAQLFREWEQRWDVFIQKNC